MPHRPADRPDWVRPRPAGPGLTVGQETIGLAAILATVALTIAGCGQASPQPTGASTEQHTVSVTASAGLTASPSPIRAPEQATAIARTTEQAASALPTLLFSFGTPGIEPGQIQLPFDVAVDGQGNIYVSDSKGVQKFDSEGQFLLAIEGVKVAQGRAASADGTLFVSGFGPQVLVFGPDGTQRGTIGEPGTDPGQLSQPVDVALAEGSIFVADSGNYRIEKFAPDGSHLLSLGERGSMSGQFTAPRTVAVDERGQIYVGMGDDYLIQRFNADGTYLDTLGHSNADETMWRVGGLAVGQGRLYVSRVIARKVQAFDLSERRHLLWELGTGSQATLFSAPAGLDVSGDRLYVADTNANRILVFQLP